MGIGVLGTATIEEAGGLPSRDRTVLAALVLDAPDPVSPERLGDALWGDDLPASWSKVLQGAVSRLRRVLGVTAIRLGPGGYRLSVPSEELDVRQFETLVELAERELAIDPSGAARHLDEARLLWRGEPFSDLAHWSHAAGAIRRLQARRRLLDELRVEILLAGRRFDEAVAAAGALLEEEPLDERGAALLATSLYRAGRTVEALGVLRGVRRRLRTELGLQPGPGLVALELAVLRHDPSLQAADHGGRSDTTLSHRRSVSGNLPAPLSRLFGRDVELAQVDAALVDERLVVLTGVGGVGKTRLAVAAADRARPAFAAGVWLVEFAATNDGADILLLLSDVLGFVTRDGLTARDVVLEGIRERPMLLVLDNCEHVIDAVAGFAVDALQRCSRLRILATSREVFGVDGEHVVLVPPLRIDTDAVDLFIDRARSSDPSLQADDRVTIEDICRRLDGIPLAIELAASRARTLSLSDLAARLGERLDFLAARGHGTSIRHRTMRAAFDWSYELLDDTERLAFSRLSVFAGPFDLAAAEAVIGGSPLGTDLLDVLEALVDKSLVVADTTSRAPFRLLEPLRQYAAEHVAARGETTDLARRHACYYADLGADLATALEGPSEIDAAKRFDAAHANLRAAFATAAASEDADLALRIVAPLAGYTLFHVWAEPWSWCHTALALPGADTHPLRAATLVHASRGAWQVGDHTAALDFADHAIALADTNCATWRDAQTCRATALTFLGRLDEAEESATAAVEPMTDTPDRGNLHRTATMLLIRNLAGHRDPALARQLLTLAEAAGPSIHALALHTAAVVSDRDDRSLAIARNQRAVELARASGAALIEGFALNSLAIQEAAVRPAAGAARHVEMMARYLSVGNGTHLRGFGRGIIVPLVECGAYEAASVVDGATRTDAPVLPTLTETIKNAINRAHDKLGSTYHIAVSRGEQMTDDDLVDYLRHVVTTLTD